MHSEPYIARLSAASFSKAPSTTSSKYAGIRQGCPLSPVLFSATVDILLRRLSRLIPDAMFRAFADDIGAIPKNLPRDADLLFETFREFGRISGLELNLPKTVIIPLWDEDLEQAKARIVTANTGWAPVAVSYRGTYLGFAVGPEKGDSSWDKPIQKYIDRVRTWGVVGQGLHIGIYAYNTYAASVLSFPAQLEAPP